MDNHRRNYRFLNVQPDDRFETSRVGYHTLWHRLKQHPIHVGNHWNATVLNDAFQTLKDEKMCYL